MKIKTLLKLFVNWLLTDKMQAKIIVYLFGFLAIISLIASFFNPIHLLFLIGCVVMDVFGINDLKRINKK